MDDPPASRELFWRVRAELSDDLLTEWSSTRSLTLAPLVAPELVRPDDDVDNTITDVVLEWSPVAGARTYELRVGTDDQFNELVVDADGLMATRWSPTRTLPNDQYWWQVHAVDTAGNVSAWSNVDSGRWSFRRAWVARPTVQHPGDSLTPIGPPLHLQWSPVAHASEYQLQVGTDPNFSSPADYDECTTRQTTYTFHIVGNRCGVSVGVVTYWRVRAVDAPEDVEGLWSTPSRFVYSPGLVIPETPADGATVSVPLAVVTAGAGSRALQGDDLA